MGALGALAVGRTTVFVAHRLSTVMHCDLICVPDRGVVVERGTHETLLQDGGMYAEMWAAQQHRRGEEPQPRGDADDARGDAADSYAAATPA